MIKNKKHKNNRRRQGRIVFFLKDFEEYKQKKKKSGKNSKPTRKKADSVKIADFESFHFAADNLHSSILPK